jgi:AcrR family transcriptional regulator
VPPTPSPVPVAAAAAPARSTADARRATVVACAVRVFARSGFHGTPVTEVAEAAGISQAYVFRLFPSKVDLFVAALDHCYALVRDALTAGAARVPDGSPQDVLAALTDTYAGLTEDRDLLMLQVHAQSAAGLPQVRAAIQRGYASLVEHARHLSAADDAGVRRFLALGQLCHVVVAAELHAVDDDWARVLTPAAAVPSEPRADPAAHLAAHLAAHVAADLPTDPETT